MMYVVNVYEHTYTGEAETVNEAKTIACDLYYAETGICVDIDDDEVFIVQSDNKKYDETVYKEFDCKCKQLGLTEIFTTKSKSTYEWMLNKLQCRNAKGYGDDWNCKFEIRFR